MSLFTLLQRLCHIRETRPRPAPVQRHAVPRQPPAPPQAGPLAGLARQAPTGRHVQTQTDPADFAQPTPPALASAAMYHQIDFKKTAASRLPDDIQAAVESFGRRVSFREVRDGDRRLGYIATSRGHAAQLGHEAPRPILFIAGSGHVAEERPSFAPSGPRLVARRDNGGLIEAARRMRRDPAPPGRGLAPQAVPNYLVSPAGEQAPHTRTAALAEFVNNAGLDPQHLQPVDVFLPADDSPLRLSTLMRNLPPGVHASVHYVFR